MIPTILAIHPEIRDLNPQEYQRLLLSLNPIAYEYRIGQVVQKYVRTNRLLARVSLNISNQINTLQEEIDAEKN